MVYKMHWAAGIAEKQTRISVGMGLRVLDHQTMRINRSIRIQTRKVTAIP